MKTTIEINPIFIKNSKNSIPANVVINILGMEEIEKIVPPTFTKIACVNI